MHYKNSNNTHKKAQKFNNQFSYSFTLKGFDKTTVSHSVRFDKTTVTH